MRNKLVTGIIVFVLALVGTGLGSVVGRLVPSAGGSLFDSKPASAQGLTAQAAGPLTPSPLGSGFTYQGKLLNNGSPVSGSYDFTFHLYDEAVAGALVSGPISVTSVISNGLFTANLDFGSPATTFNGQARYLEIATRQTGGGAYTTLSPRQPITPAPYALYSLKTKGYKNVVTVSPDGGDYTSVTAALNSITTNSAANKYLVWVGPGAYTETVTMKQYVDIEGSGEKTTKISFTGSALFNTGTVVGANNAELRSLTVENTGGNTNATAIYNSSASPSLLHVTAIASGGSSSNLGVFNISNSSPTMTNVMASASGGGFTNYGVYNTTTSSPTMTNVTASASGATTTNYGVYNSSSSPTMTNVTASGSGGNSSNYGVFNNSSSAPTMTNVTASGSGGTSSNYGVYNGSSAPTMTNVMATASGGSGSYGVFNSASSSPTMTNVTATASGGSNSYGVFNSQSAPTMTNVTASGSGGSSNYGVYNSAGSGTYTVTIDNSTITGATNTIRSDSEFTTRVGSTKLNGGAVLPNGGVVTCAGVHDENYAFFASTCP